MSFRRDTNNLILIFYLVSMSGEVHVGSGMCAETSPPVFWTGKTKCGRVFICLDGYFCFFLNSYVSWSPVRRTAQSALHIMLLSYYIGMCVFHERQRDICRRRAYSQGFAKAVHMSNDRQHFDPA